MKSGDMKIIPVRGLPIQTVWQLIWLTGKNLSPVASSFLSYVEKEKKNIVDKNFKEVTK